MTLPSGVRAGVEAALEAQSGRPDRIAATERLGGGCVSPVARLETGTGARFFLKWSTSDQPAGLLPAEARGLGLLAATRTVRVPEIVATSPGTGDWLLLEWIEPGDPGPESWSRLGADLAALHHVRGTGFGADEANFIGPLPQANEPTDSWPEFWRSRRLEPQVRRASDHGLLEAEDLDRFRRLMSGLDERIGVGDAEGPSTLHGDLWNGNVHRAAKGPPAVIDPSAYHGHREVDLAMAELFGGFGPEFHAAYEEVWPLESGYRPVRRAVYQLYYLLVHVNLFGASYLSGCRRALQDAGV